MTGGVTHHLLPNLSGVPYLHVIRTLVCDYNIWSLDFFRKNMYQL